MRELCKQCVLGVAYGMEAKSLALRIGQPEIVARDLLRAHRETYRKFWAWSDAMVDRAMLGFPLWTAFGWPLRIGSDPNPRSMRNFRCQANGSEMLRLAACFATEQGIEVCALIHDAVLIAAPLDRLDHDIERMQAAMAKASRVVLDGFELRTDVNAIRYPDRYQDPRGEVMWDRVMELVAKREAAEQAVAHDGRPGRYRHREAARRPGASCSRRRKSKRKEWRRNFTVVPRAWELRLLECEAGLHLSSLALELLYIHWLDKGKPIAVTSKVAAAAKLSARSKSNALAELEQLGLIPIDRSARRSPRVVLLLMPSG